VRFWDDDDDGTEWVGNFQGRQNWSPKIFHWPEAESMVVLATNDLYLVGASNPDDYTILEYVDDVMMDEERSLLFGFAFSAVHAFGRNRRKIWSQERLNGYDPQFESCREGVLSVVVEEELGGGRKVVRLSAQDGALL
jgi:hypothetical protein